MHSIADGQPRKMVCGCPVVIVKTSRRQRRVARRLGAKRTDIYVEHTAGCRFAGWGRKDGAL